MTQTELRGIVSGLCETYGPERAREILLERIEREPELKEALAEFYWMDVATTPISV